MGMGEAEWSGGGGSVAGHGDVMTSGPLSGLKLLVGRAVPAHVPRVRPRQGLLLRDVPAWARSSPGRARLGSGQKNGPGAGPGRQAQAACHI